VGFINPAIYGIAAGSNYSTCFHDITTGNNTWSSSPSLFYARTGYDLCTGLGTPNGAALITSLVGTLGSLGISPVTGFAFSGIPGGPFNPVSGTLQLTNRSGTAVNWSLINTSTWLTASASSGTLAANTATNLQINLAVTVGNLAVGFYSNLLTLTNKSAHTAQTIPAALAVGQSIVQNGGFETGDFTGWTQSGDSNDTQISTNASYVHSGNYSAVLGPPSTPGYLGQNLATYPGQTYLFSFWLRNPTGGTPNQFQALWNNTLLVAQTNLTGTAWNHFQLLVAATGTVTPLQFGIIDSPDYLALDDVSVTPVAPLSFKSTARLTNNFQLTWNTSTGIVYQVQYKTNLIQASWINLGGPATAGANTLTVTDTNALRAASQRYYRLITTP
jgi:hypothetical protein